MNVMTDLLRIRLAAGPHLPLTLFTLLGQTALGLVWVIHLHVWIDPALMVTPLQLLWPLTLMGLSLGASFFHLHYPWNAWRSLRNWRSPLSQEALSAALFMAFLTWETLGKTGWLPRFVPIAVPTWLVDLAGLLLLVTMIRLYQLRTIPVWNRRSTAFSFLATALLMGGGLHIGLVKTLSSVDMMVLGSGLVLRWLARDGAPISSLGGAIQNSPHRLPGWWRAMGRVEMSQLGLAALILSGDAILSSSVVRVLGLVLINLAEFAGRVMFYARHGHDRSVFPPVTPAISSWQESLE